MVVETLVWTEWLMVAVFIAGVVACGFVKHRSTSSLEGAFLAGRKIPGFVAALSTVATNMNAMDFIARVGAIYVVGTLILITPLSVSVPGNLVAMDWIAGSILVVVGIACIIWGRRRAT